MDVALDQQARAGLMISESSAGARVALVAYSLGECPETEHPLHHRGPMAWRRVIAAGPLGANTQSGCAGARGHLV